MKFLSLLFRRHEPLPDLPPLDKCIDDEPTNDMLDDAQRRTEEVERQLQLIDAERYTYRNRRS